MENHLVKTTLRIPYRDSNLELLVIGSLVYCESSALADVATEVGPRCLFITITTIGRLCEKCDGKCVICDSYVRPCTLVRICDECNYGSYQGRCVICGGPGVSDAYYCKECTIQEKDRDGCPKIVNLGSSKTDLFYERKKYGFKRR
uniref:(California timema) hypothetical protein n=1 Tax=Timema californicum TaxID=61474 RepID=A0A7R9J1F8_TIMCA|nr:unnamed protein product [Timema californicum]